MPSTTYYHLAVCQEVQDSGFWWTVLKGKSTEEGAMDDLGLWWAQPARGGALLVC